MKAAIHLTYILVPLENVWMLRWSQSNKKDTTKQIKKQNKRNRCNNWRRQLSYEAVYPMATTNCPLRACFTLTVARFNQAPIYSPYIQQFWQNHILRIIKQIIFIISRCFVCSFSIWPTLLMRLFSFQVAPLLASMYQPSLSPHLFLPKQIHPHHDFWPIGILNLLGSTNQSASMYISLKLSAFVSSTNTSSCPISWDCRSYSCSPIGSYNFNESTIQNAWRCLPHLDSVLSLS